MDRRHKGSLLLEDYSRRKELQKKLESLMDQETYKESIQITDVQKNLILDLRSKIDDSSIGRSYDQRGPQSILNSKRNVNSSHNHGYTNNLRNSNSYADLQCPDCDKDSLSERVSRDHASLRNGSVLTVDSSMVPGTSRRHTKNQNSMAKHEGQSITHNSVRNDIHKQQSAAIVNQLKQARD